MARSRTTWPRLALNAAGFQLGWLACVIGGAGVGGIVGGVVLAAHLIGMARPGEWRWLVIFGLTGLAIDGSLALLGGYRFAPEDVRVGPLALWLLWLWPLFAMLIHHSLYWLWARPWLAALGGAISAPLSYFGGAKLAGVALAPWLLPSQAVIWALICLTVSLAAAVDTSRHRLARTALQRLTDALAP